MFVILVLIILVASFNIVGTLIMNVIEKSREIAILKAMGATKKALWPYSCSRDFYRTCRHIDRDCRRIHTRLHV